MEHIIADVNARERQICSLARSGERGENNSRLRSPSTATRCSTNSSASAEQGAAARAKSRRATASGYEDSRCRRGGTESVACFQLQARTS
jgi:hypothetical protein